MCKEVEESSSWEKKTLLPTFRYEFYCLRNCPQVNESDIACLYLFWHINREDDQFDFKSKS